VRVADNPACSGSHFKNYGRTSLKNVSTHFALCFGTNASSVQQEERSPAGLAKAAHASADSVNELAEIVAGIHTVVVSLCLTADDM